MKFIVMAGGQGTKLWPLSKDNYPKQFTNIIGNKSLFQRNIDDLLSEYEPDDIFVSTSEDYEKYAREQAPMLPPDHFILEPHIKRNTGPASCYAMVHMLMKHPEEVVGFYVQPVVIREPRKKYIEMLKEMEKLVKKHGQLITGGMKPTHPEVGSDYIALGPTIKNSAKLKIHTDNKFVNRPKTMKKAKHMIENLNLAIHCNHYAWTSKHYFESLQRHHPKWYETSMKIYKQLTNNEPYKKIAKTYSKYTPGKVEDFTQKLYENEGVQVVILPFKWIHITTWNDVYEYLKKNKKATTPENTIEIDSKNNIVINNGDTLINLLGVKDMVVINNGGTMLICPKDKSGEIQKVLDAVKNKGLEELL